MTLKLCDREEAQSLSCFFIEKMRFNKGLNMTFTLNEKVNYERTFTFDEQS